MATSRPGAAAILGCAAALSGGMLLRRERVCEIPLWPTDLLALRPFRSAVVASVCCFIAQSAGLLALPFHLQLGLRRGPMGAGLVMTCWPLAVAITSLLANRLAERFGSARLCVAGGATLAAGLALSALCPVSGGGSPLAAGAVLCGVGFGLFQTPNNRTLFLSAPVERSAAAGGMQGSARLTGQTIGSLMMSLLFAGASAMLAPRVGFALGAGFAVAAALVSALELRRTVSLPRPRSPVSVVMEGEAP
jgi:DHA2 family multidrug resistance protein-like MFS transporter